MKEKIIELLDRLSEEKGIEILLAIESGSRAWGFPSPDSDFDVRVIYRLPVEQYLAITERKDNFNFFEGELLDISGWDLRKALGLMRKSNASLYEWINSPIVYFKDDEFHQKLKSLSVSFFQPVHGFNHYKGLAYNAYKDLDMNGEIKLKKLFYVLRPILAAKWILKFETIPPINIHKLLEIITGSNIHKKIVELLRLKAEVNEDYIYKVEKELIDFIDHAFKVFKTAEFNQKETPDVEVLNAFFRVQLGM